MKTIGEQLKHARLSRGLSLSEAASATAIRAQYLEALEADEFDALHSSVQARGFLRNYASFSGLPPDALLEQLIPTAPPSQGIRKVLDGTSIDPHAVTAETPANTTEEYGSKTPSSQTAPGEQLSAAQTVDGSRETLAKVGH